MKLVAHVVMGVVASLGFAFSVFLVIFGLLSDLYTHSGRWLETLLITITLAVVFWLARRWVVARLPEGQKPFWKGAGWVLCVLMSAAAIILFGLNG